MRAPLCLPGVRGNARHLGQVADSAWSSGRGAGGSEIRRGLQRVLEDQAVIYRAVQRHLDEAIAGAPAATPDAASAVSAARQSISSRTLAMVRSGSGPSGRMFSNVIPASR
jgi:hypothetical protein